MLTKKSLVNLYERMTAGFTGVEQQLNSIKNTQNFYEQKIRDIGFLVQIAEERSRTLEYELNRANEALKYQNELLLSWYTESTDKRAINKNIQLVSDHPIATDSNDHITPDSTQEGVVRPTLFVKHCLDIVGKDCSLLDLGTGGAGLIYECLLNGINAVGIDGSDYCFKYGLGYWPLINDHLYTCDITKPFKFVDQEAGSPLEFNIITMWEVLEHIQESDLHALFRNITQSLRRDGFYIGSISLLEYNDPNGVPYHVTLKPKEWWQNKFAEGGLKMIDDHPFNCKLFYRGVGNRYQDIHDYHKNPECGFHFVAQKI